MEFVSAGGNLGSEIEDRKNRQDQDHVLPVFTGDII